MAPVVLALVVLGTVLLRVPYLTSPLTSDEGGFLMVARGWRAGGTSLYGDHWVDRPPLLIAIYKVAVLLGGEEPLRVIGTLAAAATVALVGFALLRIAGPAAAVGSATVAAALLGTPAVGAVAVNGELLAAPFVAAGLGLLLVATTVSDRRRFTALLVGAGAAAALAVMIKQNMLDVGVFGVVLGLCAARRAPSERARWRHGARWAVAGFVGAGSAVLGLAAALGSAPGAVLFAMYPFRLKAAPVMAYVPWSMRADRIGLLAEWFAASGAPLLLLLLLALLVRRRVPALWAPAAVATTCLVLFDLFSVLAGGSYWQHYLVQLVVPTSIAAGLLIASSTRRLVPALAVGLVVVLCAGEWVVGLSAHVETSAQQVGRALRQASQPGDSVVSLLGDGNIAELAGLSAPYPYLWSLPSRTLDPQLSQLDQTLTGPTRPTWVVVRGEGTAGYVAQRPVGAALRDEYREVGTVCGRTVLLRAGLTRPALRAPATCRLPLVPSAAHLIDKEPFDD